MELTLIISYYRAFDNLKIILKALGNQSFKDFEVIVSEDDFNEETISFINDNGHLYPFPISHIYQKEDNGFRKNMMLNRSVLHSNADKLVFIDGDCIPHKHFIKQYIKNLKPGYFLLGRRVMLGKKLSSYILREQSFKRLQLFSLFFSDSKKIKESIYNPYFKLALKTRGLVGCNWSIMKQYLIDVNGFDEDYVRVGVGEDCDIEWRLIESGLKKKSIKNKAITYHLYHPETHSDENSFENYELLKRKMQAKHISCKNGLEKQESINKNSKNENPYS